MKPRSTSSVRRRPAHDRPRWSGSVVEHGLKKFESLARTPISAIGVYRCGHRNCGRGIEEQSAHYVINFPRQGVYVKHVAGATIVVDPRVAVLFNRGECYCTSHPYGTSDAGIYLSLRHDVLLEIAAAREPRVHEAPDRIFAHTHLDLAPELELESVALAADADRMEPAELEERALGLTAALVRLDRGTHARRATETGRERREHHDLADAARELCALRFRERLGLDTIARSLGVSVFHLCRVFRARHGTSLHAHLTRLRLAAALEELACRDSDLTALGLSLGFSSHSHFARAFRRGFGLAPTQFRSRPGRPT